MLLDYLEIDQLFSVIGGSMGGMQAMQWAVSHPERCFTSIPIAAAARHSAQNIAFHEVGRQAIMADPDWSQGGYLAGEIFPVRGLAVARMAALVPDLTQLFPAHNTPAVDPSRLIELQEEFAGVRDGTLQGTHEGDDGDMVRYEAGAFSLLLRAGG